MKNTGLIIAAVVLAALTGALYWSNRHPASESTTKASLDTPPKILSLKQEDISKIEIKKKGGEELDLAKGDGGKWQITAPKPLGADQEAVGSLLSTVSSLNSDRLVDDKASDLGQYGLSQPSLEVDVTAKDAKPQKLYLGDTTPAGNAVFAKLEGEASAHYNLARMLHHVNEDEMSKQHLQIALQLKPEMTPARDRPSANGSILISRAICQSGNTPTVRSSSQTCGDVPISIVAQ